MFARRNLKRGTSLKRDRPAQPQTLSVLEVAQVYNSYSFYKKKTLG